MCLECRVLRVLLRSKDVARGCSHITVLLLALDVGSGVELDVQTFCALLLLGSAIICKVMLKQHPHAAARNKTKNRSSDTHSA